LHVSHPDCESRQSGILSDDDSEGANDVPGDVRADTDRVRHQALEAIEQQARDRLEALVPAETLILVGIHGRNPIDLALFGSTTNQLVRCAPCPVLTMCNDHRRT
jgi:hypothetical protein